MRKIERRNNRDSRWGRGGHLSDLNTVGAVTDPQASRREGALMAKFTIPTLPTTCQTVPKIAVVVAVAAVVAAVGLAMEMAEVLLEPEAMVICITFFVSRICFNLYRNCPELKPSHKKNKT